MAEMKVKCLYDKLIPIDELIPHPKNRNKHPKEQIDRLAKILEYQGWRYPVKVSRLSGCITTGHGRVEAARANKWTHVPVNYQSYDSNEQEYADVQADNAIAFWAEMDFSGINADLPDLGPDFDIDLLGIKNFLLEPADKFIEKELYGEEIEGIGLEKNLKVIVIIKNGYNINQVLNILNVSKRKNWQEGSVVSVHWPEEI